MKNWKKELNNILWENVDLDKVPERPMKVKTQEELETFIQSLLQEFAKEMIDKIREAKEPEPVKFELSKIANEMLEEQCQELIKIAKKWGVNL